MPLFTANDSSSGSPISTPSRVNLAPNTANRDAMFGNTTADAFITGETIGVFGVDATEIAVGNKYLSAVAANNGGTGGSFVPGNTLNVENTGATVITGAQVAVVSTKVRTASVAAGGTGYANGDTITLATGSGSNAGVFTVTTGAADNIVASVAITNAGSFTTNPTLTGGATAKITGSGTGCTLTVTMKIDSVAVLSPGNYTVVPTEVDANQPTGGGGTGATLALTFGSRTKGIAHTGWNLRKVGSGGRAGRVTYETLVAGGISNDASDDSTLADS